MDRRYAAGDLLDKAVDWRIQDTAYEKGRLARNVRVLRQTLNRIRPDALVTYNWGAIEWALASFGRACPHIHIVDGFGPEEADRQLLRRVLFRRFAFARNTTVVVPSRTLKDIVTSVWRIAPTNVAYVPNGIDCTRFDRVRDAKLAETFGLTPDNLVIGTVAALRPEKNLERLIRAFHGLAEDESLRLVIVGDGAERPKLEHCARELRIADQVVFTGYLSDPAPILSVFDIFALSSDTEQMPISVLEAMASRLPVAGVDVGDVRHIVSDRNKAYIVERDVDRLRNVLSALANDATLRDQLGTANRQHVQEVYDETMMVNAYARIFDG